MADTDIAIDETSELIASNKVESTAVYSSDGEKLGSIHNLMIDKRTGQVEYGVLTFGGLFGLGQDYHPVPWDLLEYDTDQGGYVVELDKKLLEGSPRYGADDEPSYDRAYAEQVHDYYGVPYPA